MKRLQRFSGELQKMLTLPSPLTMIEKLHVFFCHRPRKAFKTNYGKVESVNG